MFTLSVAGRGVFVAHELLFLRSQLFSSLSTDRAHLVGEIATGAALGTAVFAALTLGFSLATLGVFVPNVVLRRLSLSPALTPPPFDAREYPPLFNLARPPHSVARFWSQQWHRSVSFVLLHQFANTDHSFATTVSSVVSLHIRTWRN
jgi:hypothetical protein